CIVSNACRGSTSRSAATWNSFGTSTAGFSSSCFERVSPHTPAPAPSTHTIATAIIQRELKNDVSMITPRSHVLQIGHVTIIIQIPAGADRPGRPVEIVVIAHDPDRRFLEEVAVAARVVNPLDHILHRPAAQHRRPVLVA